MTFRDLDLLQWEIGSWASTTFPHHTSGSIADHVEEEARELVQAVDERGAKVRSVGEEAADVAILLLTLAHRRRFSLAEAIAAKHRINQGRECGEPTVVGVVHHVGHTPTL